MIDLEATFEKHADEYLAFDRVENKLHARPDLCAFLLLDKLVPGEGEDIISASEHDQFYLSVEPDELAEVATEDDILTLVRCGVMYSEDEGLSMFS